MTSQLVVAYGIVVFYMEAELTAQVHAPALPMVIADAAPDKAP